MTEEIIASPWLSFVAVGVLLAGIGQAIGVVVGDSTARLAVEWRRTRAAHPIIAGLALGWFADSLAVPPAFGEGTAARVLCYGVAGVLAVPVYEIVRAALARRAA